MTEARRQLEICNSCRYCEGYCDTFLAIERRPSLADGDIALIANICHDCRGCYQACMYSPPHEFAIEIPTLLSAVRADSQRRYSWPARARALVARPVRAVTGGAFSGLVLFVAIVLVTGEPSRLITEDAAPGAFYRIIPFEFLLFGATALVMFAALSWAIVATRFARDARLERVSSISELWSTMRDALRLSGMSGGGAGCYFPDEARPTRQRRRLHVLVVLGFILANISTASAAAYQHVLGELPPYPVLSAPVLFGIAGGIAMIAGTTGLLALKVRASGRLISRDMLRTDWSFLVVLDLVSITGMLTLVLRATPLMGVMLLLHYATLVALFFTVPYGKFSHVLFRLLALYQKARWDTLSKTDPTRSES